MTAKMNIKYRTGQPEDASAIAQYVYAASGGIADFLLNDILPDGSILDFISTSVLDPYSLTSYNNTIVAEMNNNIIGAVSYYPAEQHKITEEMLAFIPEDRLKHLEPLFTSRVEDSLYLYTLAVSENAKNHNVGYGFLMSLGKIAIAANFKKLSAHVWADNKAVLDILLGAGGFKINKKIVIKEHPLLPHQGGMFLLERKLSPLEIAYYQKHF